MKERIVILGAGESGTGSAILAQKMGYDVLVSDNGMISDKYKPELIKRNIAFEENGHTMDEILKAIEVIKSPGIPDHIELIKTIRNANIPVISELEFAARYTDAKLICITGSNGKTTTTLLTHHILTKAGLNAGLAGNVGESFAWQVAEKNFDYYVLEISSFQLDGMYDFKADIAILTNITPDHLDRYDYKFENYIDSKFRIIQNQTNSDHFIYCADDPVTAKEVEKRNIAAKLNWFTQEENQAEATAWVENKEIKIRNNKNIFSMYLESLALQGRHNTYNSMAAGITASLLDVSNEVIREALSDFQNAEHRLEHVSTVHGIDFINDSKATNVNSTWYALECQTNPVIWIVGGVDKGNDYSELTDLVKEKVKAIICLGVDNKPIIDAFKGEIANIIETNSMVDAVKQAYLQGTSGDVVLLSPACASFDLFDSYEDRGRKFKGSVRDL